jgi:hypothetical protein
MTTYLTWFALKADSNCFKFSSIGGRAMRAIPLDAHLMTRRNPLTRRNALPVAIFLVLHILERLEFLRNHLHNIILAIRHQSRAGGPPTILGAPFMRSLIAHGWGSQDATQPQSSPNQKRKSASSRSLP